MSDSSTSAQPLRIAVLGGGVSGLAAAHRLLELAPHSQVTLFEAGDRCGGCLDTRAHEGYLIERSADMFTTREPWAIDLCRRIGLEGELIETNAQHRRAFVVGRGQLHPVPEGFTLMTPVKVGPMLRTPLLSWSGKLRMGCERFLPRRRDPADESLADFARRRFGREGFERLIQPLIGGIYTADPERLSMQATLPQFVELERKYGSLIKGMRAQEAEKKSRESAAAAHKGPAGAGARYGLFVAPRLGMRQLVERIVSRLPAGSIRLNSRVSGVSRMTAEDGSQGWRLELVGGESARFDRLIVALPAHAAGAVLRGIDPPLADLVGQIPHAGCAVAVLGYRREQIAHKLDGFGFVVPHREGRKVIAGSFTSVKFAGRAPEGKVLFRVFVGGALQPELSQLSDAETETLVRKELAELLGVSGAPEFCQIVRWNGTMPQYHLGHLDLVARIEARAAEIPAFALAGNAYRGVGIPFCIRSGEQAAERVLVPA